MPVESRLGEGLAQARLIRRCVCRRYGADFRGVHKPGQELATTKRMAAMLSMTAIVEVRIQVPGSSCGLEAETTCELPVTRLNGFVLAANETER